MGWYARWGILATLLLPVMVRGDDDKKDNGLEGTWKFVSLESDGEMAPPTVIEKWRWVIRDGEIHMGDAAQGEQKSSYKLDETKKPKTIDMTALDGDQKGKTLKCIYQLDGEILKICLPEGKQANEEQSRPTEFDGGKGRSLIVLERVKDK
jgi:uncharacterized protein (TIGR03067 family)